MFSCLKSISLFLVSLVITGGGVSAESISTHIPKSSHPIAQSFNGWVTSIWQRHPKRRPNASRSISSVCAISPGILDTLFVWNDKPLFLWHNSGTGEKTQLIVREKESQKIVLMQPVNIADKKFLYNGTQPLEPGKTYQWQLGSTEQKEFKTMSASEHGKIQADLQALEQKLKANKANQEEIAQRKALYFLNYQVKDTIDQKQTFNPWSDALEAL
ncbi:MAG: hypothetical protein PUP91_19690 [Rhizonema sp. PD37]|nr:hypothetical protein [Rhizonema sp. PD37]